MKPVLILENSKSVAESISTLLHRELGLQSVTAHSLDAARYRLAANPAGYSAGICGLFLTDATGIDIIDFALAHNIPPIVFTGTMQPEMRREMWARDIVDYVVKESPESLRHIINIMRRLERNQNVEVLVADPRTKMRTYVSGMLQRHKFQVLEAENGNQAKQIMDAHPEIRLALLGDVFKDMDPEDFIDRCRRDRDKEELSIITLCRQDNTEVAIQCLKRGADDFLAWPFSAEEFYSRINNCLDTLDLFTHLRTITRTDFLTGVYNRGYLMTLMTEEFQRSVRYERPLSVVMLDADKFKNINDTYGHATGDLVLIKLAEIVGSVIRAEDSFGRFGGEEFVLALPETDEQAATMAAERVREIIEATAIPSDDGDVTFTVSFGVATYDEHSQCKDLHTLLNQADEALYAAKEHGRNRVIHHSALPVTSG